MSTFTVEELLKLEHAGWRSLCESQGGSFYGDLMAPEALFVLVNGMALNRDQVAESLNGAPAWDTHEITDARLIPLGEDSAALVYHASSARADLDTPFNALMSSVYCPVDGHPRLALYQQTTATH